MARRRLVLTSILISIAGALVLPVVSAVAQSQAAATDGPAFEVASVKHNSDRSVQPALRYTPAGIDFARVPLTWVVGEAYGIPYYSLTALVANDKNVRELLYLPSNRYDISARAKGTASHAQLRLMLQRLLADRFKLALHSESTIEQVYKLIVGRSGSKIRKSADQSDTGQPVISSTGAAYEFRHVEMARFVGFLSGQLDRPVIDVTMLEGFYDFTLRFDGDAPGDKSQIREWIASSILSETESQLGLKLEAAKGQVSKVIIDHLEAPTED